MILWRKKKRRSILPRTAAGKQLGKAFRPQEGESEEEDSDDDDDEEPQQQYVTAAPRGSTGKQLGGGGKYLRPYV